MELILDKQKTKGKRAHRLQRRFNQLRDKVRKERRRGESFRQDIDDLVQTFQRRSMESDRSILNQLIDLSNKLVAFAGRKSLAEWHRDELNLWLRELINDRISMIDPDAGDRLRQEFVEVVTGMMGISVDELAAQYAADLEADAHPFAQDDDIGAQTDTEETPPQADLFGFSDDDMEEADADDADDIDFEAAFAEAFEAFGMNWDDDAEISDDSQALMDGRWAKSLFRRAAQALHPDREQDPERRKKKQEHMQALLRARKEDDILTMLTIYSEHVSGDDIVLAEHEMTQICDELEGQLEAIEFEKDTYVYTDPIRHIVFDLFYHSTSKGRARRIKAWEESLQEEASRLKKLVPFLRNLTHLKEVLGERRNERDSTMFAMMMDDDELRF